MAAPVSKILDITLYFIGYSGANSNTETYKLFWTAVGVLDAPAIPPGSLAVSSQTTHQADTHFPCMRELQQRASLWQGFLRFFFVCYSSFLKDHSPVRCVK